MHHLCDSLCSMKGVASCIGWRTTKLLGKRSGAEKLTPNKKNLWYNYNIGTDYDTWKHAWDTDIHR